MPIITEEDTPPCPPSSGERAIVQKVMNVVKCQIHNRLNDIHSSVDLHTPTNVQVVIFGLIDLSLCLQKGGVSNSIHDSDCL